MMFYVPKYMKDVSCFNLDSPLDSDKMFYIVHKIISSSIFHNKSDGSKIGCELSSKHLKSIIGNDYRCYMDMLLNKYVSSTAPILTTDNHYVTGKKSKTYYINSEIMTRGLIAHELSAGSVKRKLLRRKKIKLCNGLHRFEFDYTKALEHLSVLIDQKKDFTLWTQIYVFNALKTGDYWFFRDEKTTRLHHPFTSLKKDFRKYISVNNEELYEIDLKNAQPFLLAAIINHFFFSLKPSNEMKVFISKSDSLRNLKRVGRFKNKRSLTRFIKYSVQGVLYEQIIIMLNDRGAAGWTREQVKQSFFIYLFSRVTDSFFARVLNEEFPDLVDFIRQIKHLNYKELAISLQRLEAHIFIDHIAKDVERLVTLDYYTIHDSIHVQRRHVLMVANICRETIFRIAGIEGTLGFDTKIT